MYHQQQKYKHMQCFHFTLPYFRLLLKTKARSFFSTTGLFAQQVFCYSFALHSRVMLSSFIISLNSIAYPIGSMVLYLLTVKLRFAVCCLLFCCLCIFIFMFINLFSTPSSLSSPPPLWGWGLKKPRSFRRGLGYS